MEEICVFVCIKNVLTKRHMTYCGIDSRGNQRRDHIAHVTDPFPTFSRIQYGKNKSFFVVERRNHNMYVQNVSMAYVQSSLICISLFSMETSTYHIGSCPLCSSPLSVAKKTVLRFLRTSKEELNFSTERFSLTIHNIRRYFDVSLCHRE